MYKNILVINTMHIGDLMLVTPALRTLRTNYPEAHIALLTDKPLGDLVRCNENLDECILIDKHGRKFCRKPLTLRNFFFSKTMISSTQAAIATMS